MKLLRRNCTTSPSRKLTDSWKRDHGSKSINHLPKIYSPNHFKRVKISSVALIKMVMHAKSGGDLEIMGLMQGKVKGGTFSFFWHLDTFYVMDAFGLPVEGTETRVNAGAEANEFMCSHIDASERVDRPENVCGWYHSHPGYGCWFSGIDVGT